MGCGVWCRVYGVEFSIQSVGLSAYGIRCRVEVVQG
jgi:hypothetical protein